MDGLLFVIFLSLVLVGALLLISKLFAYLAQRKAAAEDRNTRTEPDDHGKATDWRSVRFSPGTWRCEFANLLSGKVFLLGEAPPLPLANCSQPGCSCRYIHLDDRRSGGDRRIGMDEPGQEPVPGSTDRRRRGGRRAADLAA